MNTKSRWIPVGVSVALVLLAGCSSQAAPAAAVPEGARPGDLALEACSYKIQGTEFAADCGTLVVPENRANPGSRLISVPVTRVHASAGAVGGGGDRVS